MGKNPRLARKIDRNGPILVKVLRSNEGYQARETDFWIAKRRCNLFKGVMSRMLRRTKRPQKKKRKLRRKFPSAWNVRKIVKIRPKRMIKSGAMMRLKTKKPARRKKGTRKKRKTIARL